MSNVTSRLGGASSSLAFKAPCVVATTANITLSGLQTIDGVTVVAADRVLVMYQTDASENGIYDVSTRAWSRSRDFDGAGDVVKGTRVFVHSGSTMSGAYVVTAADPIVIDTSAITFVEQSTVDGYQPTDPKLTAIINATWAADKVPYFTDEDSLATTDLTAYGRSLMASASAAAARAVLEIYAYIRVTDTGYNATGLGVVDDTAEIMACIDANKGRAIVFPRGTYLVGSTDPILLDGPDYDGTKLIFEPGAELLLAERATETTYNFYGSGCALVIRLCDDITVDNITINGNRLVQPIQEHCLSMVIAGATNVTVKAPKFREIRGDGIYICQSIPSSSSVSSQHINITDVDCYNSSADGRNTVSIVGGTDITVNGVAQQNMGGTFLYVAASGATAVSGGPVLGAAFTCTISNASPAVITKVAHGLAAGYQVYFTTTGSLPTGLTTTTPGEIGGTWYYVLATGLTADAFQVSATLNGPAINTSSAGSGVHTCVPCRWVVQPGAFVDVEPDHDYQLCQRINISNLRGSSYGTTPIGVQGITTDKTVTSDVSVSDAVVYQLSAPTIRDETGALTRTNNQIIQTSRTTGVKISNVTGRFLNAWGYGAIVTGTDNTTLTNVRVNRVHTGCNVGNGYYDAATNGVWNAEIDVYVNQISHYGFEVGKITNCKIGGWVSAPTTGQFTAMYGVICQLYTQTDSVYSVSVMPSTDWTRSYRTNGATFANTVIKDCHLGSSDSSDWASQLAQFGDVAMMRINVAGVTERTSIPTGGTFVVGQVIYNIGTDADILCWRRLTASSGASRDTDWRTIGLANETQLTTDFTGADVNTAQPVFATAQDTLTVAALTTYEFEAVYLITRAAGTTSHTLSTLFGGTATFTSVDYLAQSSSTTGYALGTTSQIFVTVATAVAITGASTSATEQVTVHLRGHFRVNAAGTIIPQFQFSAAPGGVPTIKRGSFFRCRPIGTNTAVSVGAWA